MNESSAEGNANQPIFPREYETEFEANWRHAQKMEALGRLASGVAHDFNNLLTVIGGYAQILLERVSQPGDMRDELMHILKASERAAAFTRQLLNFGSKHGPARLEALDLNDIVADQARMLRPLLGEKIELQVRAAPHLPSIDANAGNIFQILLNVAANARDAMPTGGTLTFETSLQYSKAEIGSPTAGSSKDGPVPSSRIAGPEREDGKPVLPAVGGPTRNDQPWVVLTASDTGHGIDPAARARLFEPFFTTKPLGRGTGLGLSIVADLVKQMGGRIEVDSKPERGARFSFWFRPVDQFEGIDLFNRQHASVLRGHGETILLVEEADFVRDLVHRVLSSQGYTVLTAATADDAFKVADVRPVDLLIADLMVPKQCGGDLAESLKNKNPKLRVLFVSGYPVNASERGPKHQCKEDGFLQKPFSPDSLLAAVRDILTARPKCGPVHKLPTRNGAAGE